MSVDATPFRETFFHKTLLHCVSRKFFVANVFSYTVSAVSAGLTLPSSGHEAEVTRTTLHNRQALIQGLQQLHKLLVRILHMEQHATLTLLVPKPFHIHQHTHHELMQVCMYEPREWSGDQLQTSTYCISTHAQHNISIVLCSIVN